MFIIIAIMTVLMHLIMRSKDMYSHKDIVLRLLYIAFPLGLFYSRIVKGILNIYMDLIAAILKGYVTCSLRTHP
jgi:hypothetical protein